MRGAAPFADLSRADFDAVVLMLSEGIQTGRGRRGAYLHRDRVHGLLRARRGARLAALTSGGAIPEVADYRMLMEKCWCVPLRALFCGLTMRPLSDLTWVEMLCVALLGLEVGWFAK